MLNFHKGEDFGLLCALMYLRNLIEIRLAHNG